MIVGCQTQISEVHYSGYTIDKIYACGSLVYEATPSPSAIAIPYTASTKLNVDLTKFTPTATTETFNNGYGRIEFSSDVIEIGAMAFDNKTSLISIKIPDSTTVIKNDAFGWCENLENCNIGSGVTTIERGAFFKCSKISGITLPNSVTIIEDNVFRDCVSLNNFNIPSGVTIINEGVFRGCSSLSSITMHNNISSIGNYAFYNCSVLTGVTIPDSVVSIGDYAFQRCSGLTSITIPSGVTSIGDYAFERCSGLTSIICLSTTPPTIGNGTFSYTNDCPIYVPAESVNTYKSASKWSIYYANRIQPIT